MTAEELATFISDHCTDIYRMGNQHTTHAPIAFVLDAEDGMQIVACAVGRELLRPLFERLARDGARTIGFVIEGWMAKATDVPLGTKHLSDLPPDDRQEILVCDVVRAPEEHVSWTRTITRGRQTVTLGPRKTPAQSWNRLLYNLPWQS